MISKSFKLGKVLGIDVGIDISWLFIFIIVTLDLALSVFPRLQPNWGLLLNWTTAIFASMLFFMSVLAHELAHSVVARVRGIPVNEIILFLFGGVSSIEERPDTPKTEFLMAIVGPLTSIIIGVAKYRVRFGSCRHFRD
jgi:Zn-dependent protease